MGSMKDAHQTHAPAPVAPQRHLLLRLESSPNQNQNSLSVSLPPALPHNPHPKPTPSPSPRYSSYFNGSLIQVIRSLNWNTSITCTNINQQLTFNSHRKNEWSSFFFINRLKVKIVFNCIKMIIYSSIIFITLIITIWISSASYIWSFRSKTYF